MPSTTKTKLTPKKRARQRHLVIRIESEIVRIQYWYKRREILAGPRNSHSTKIDTYMLDKARARLAEAKRGLKE